MKRLVLLAALIAAAVVIFNLVSQMAPADSTAAAETKCACENCQSANAEGEAKPCCCGKTCKCPDCACAKPAEPEAKQCTCSSCACSKDGTCKCAKCKCEGCEGKKPDTQSRQASRDAATSAR